MAPKVHLFNAIRQRRRLSRNSQSNQTAQFWDEVESCSSCYCDSASLRILHFSTVPANIQTTMAQGSSTYCINPEHVVKTKTGVDQPNLLVCKSLFKPSLHNNNPTNAIIDCPEFSWSIMHTDRFPSSCNAQNTSLALSLGCSSCSTARHSSMHLNEERAERNGTFSTMDIFN